MSDQSIMQKFENGTLDADEFGHREHVQVAWEMLRAYPFLEATSRYARCIRHLAEAVGAPQKFNMTVTLSFMSIIAEKMEINDENKFDQFFAGHPDLTTNPLKNWYSEKRMNCDLAKKIFLMPEVRTPEQPDI